MERGGFVAFEDLYLPCFTEHDIEISFYDTDDLTFNDQSTTRYVNCYSSGIIFAHDFQLGSNKMKGHYKVFGRMTQSGKINQGQVKAYSPDQIYSNKIENEDNLTKTTTSIEIDYLLNTFEVNDYWG
jgi:hypothetical protein